MKSEVKQVNVLLNKCKQNITNCHSWLCQNISMRQHLNETGLNTHTHTQTHKKQQQQKTTYHKTVWRFRLICPLLIADDKNAFLESYETPDVNCKGFIYYVHVHLLQSYAYIKVLIEVYVIVIPWVVRLYVEIIHEL